MGSKHHTANVIKTNLSLSLTRLQLLLTNKKLAFLTSILLTTLLYQTSKLQPTTKRKGVGTRDATGELHSVLRRKSQGRAAVAIIRVIDDQTHPDDEPTIKYLVQMKSHDYPIKAFRGSICLLGGNANIDDENPVDTLMRELKEELGGSTGSLNWVNKIKAENVVDLTIQNATESTKIDTNAAGQIRYLGLSLHTQSASILQKPHPYSFLCALYEITLFPHQLPPTILYPRGATVQEGRLALLTEDQLVGHAKYSWGYEYTISRYFGRNVTNFCEGVGVEDVVGGLDFGDWRPGKKI